MNHQKRLIFKKIKKKYFFCCLLIYFLYICYQITLKQKQMETTQLNNNNCKEYTTEELEAKLDALMNETTIEEDITSLHKLCAKGKKITWKVDGVITDEYREQVKKEVEAKKEFQAKWGKQCLTTFVIYSTLKTRLQNVPNNLNKSTFKLQKSKGNGYGNM